MEWWLTASDRNSSFVFTGKGSLICSLAGDMAISQSFINNCRLSSLESRSLRSHGRTNRLRRRAGGARRRRMTMSRLFRRSLCRRSASLRRKTGLLGRWLLETTTATTGRCLARPVDLGGRLLGGQSRLGHPVMSLGRRCCTERSSVFLCARSCVRFSSTSGCLSRRRCRSF